MRIYAATSEDAVRAGRLLKDWSGESYISETQRHRLQQECVCELRTTNIFLRIILFLFTLIVVAAAAALFFAVFVPHSSQQTEGVFLLIFAVASYAAAEFAASQGHLYRYGIEEALAACSVGFLYFGMSATVFAGIPYSANPNPLKSFVPGICALLSLWIWRRFGLWYAFPAAMVFALFVAGHWTSSRPEQHGVIALLYGIGLIAVMAVRTQRRLESGADDFSVAEAFLWLGIYLAINLQLSSLDLLRRGWTSGYRPDFEFSTAFYWTTWVLTWVLPPIVLLRGVRRKDRFVLAVGGISAVLTLVTNKAYLGWARHTWDPMLLGILLAGVALFLRSWLARGPNGVRGGFTAARVSGKDQQWLSASSAVLGLVTPQSITPAPQTTKADFRFGGGASGGGGAGGDF